MRTYFLIALSFILATGAMADETPVSSSISSVKIFRQRAQITEEASVKVKAGDNLLVFSGLSRHLIPSSINVKGQGKGVIQAVTHRVTYLNKTPKTPRMVALEDSLQWFANRMGQLADERFVLESEQKLLLGNQQVAGTQSGFTADQLRAVAALYRERLTEVRNGLFQVALKEKSIQQRQQAMQQELSSISSSRNQPTQEVVVTFQAEAAGTVKLSLIYLVTNASWEPFYDIRVDRTSDPLQFFLKANVVNQTGIDWSKVKVTLSTANNAGNNNSPALSPWVVDVYYPQPAYAPIAAGSSTRDAKMLSNRMEAPAPMMDDAREDVEEVSYAYDQTTVTENTLSLEFEIALPYDVPSDGQPHQIDIRKMDVPGKFQHYAVPKLDRDAFLVAEISMDLLRGKANVYFEGSFVGETYVNTDNPRDSMRVSLGRDARVQLQRAQVADFTNRKEIGGTVTQTYGFEITVRNNKTEKTTLIFEDQIPVSQNKEIKITPLELSGGVLDPVTGKVTWTRELKPGETLTVPLRFEVKYPKNRPVQGL